MTVHLGNGLFVSNNGYEFALALLAATVSLVFQGGGAYALDGLVANVIGGERQPGASRTMAAA